MKAQEMISKFAPPDLDTLGTKVEVAIGMEIEDLLKAISGDFTIAVNGVEGEAMIPVELFIGIGVNGKVLQEKLMETVQGLAAVEEEGDFFIINIQGNEIYSGIINDVLVITNAKGYKEAVSSGSFSKPLTDSKFGDFADGSLGMYVNLNLDDYPSMIKGLLSQNAKAQQMVERFTEPLDYLGISASNYMHNVVVKTSKPSENSLYTILKIVENPE